MGFTKLRNVKPGPAQVPPEGVAVTCRALNARRKKGAAAAVAHRFAMVRIGTVIARKAGISGAKHRANILIGDGLERLRCGIALDDKDGEFKLKRLASGDYQLTISERAGGGMLTLDAPAFSAGAELVPIAAGMPPAIIFDLSAEIRAA